jgi:hypothetical protein
LDAFRQKDAPLFFGRRKETLEALACLGDQQETNPDWLQAGQTGQYRRWLQIEGNSGAGKSSLVQAGMLPMIEQGALWARTGFTHWRILGPMMPGRDPLTKLAEVVERSLVSDPERRDALRRLERLEQDERALALALRDQRQERGGRFCSSSISSRSSSPLPTRRHASASMPCWPTPWTTPNARCS